MPEVWLWALVVVNVCLGASFSPLTAVQKVRVVGAASSDTKRLMAELQRVQGTPVLRLSNNEVVSAVEQNGEVKSAKLSTNLFGRAVLNVSLREPVARILGTKVFLDVKGSTFRSERSFEGLPSVIPPPRAFATSLTVLNGWESGKTAQLCQLLSAQVPKVAWKVELNERGVISLQADSGAEVVMGSSESLPQKVEKLRALLEAKPELLLKVRQLNLTFPEAPMFVR